jgi:hypothetical protein
MIVVQCSRSVRKNVVIHFSNSSTRLLKKKSAGSLLPKIVALIAFIGILLISIGAQIKIEIIVDSNYNKFFNNYMDACEMSSVF